MRDLSFLRSHLPADPRTSGERLGRAGQVRSPHDTKLERTIMRRILVLASAAAVAMLAFSPLAQAQAQAPTPPAMPHSTTVHKTTAHVTKAKKKAPVKHKVAAKKTVKKKKPAVRTS